MTFQANPPPPSNGNNADEYWMARAIKLAKKAQSEGEVPIGAVLIYKNKIIGEGWNCPITTHDPTAHAEIIALREGAKTLKNYRLNDCMLYITLEPCAMCVGAIIHSRINRCVFATWDPKAGAVRSALSLLDAPHFNHRVQWSEGFLQQEAQTLLQRFFHQKR